MENIEITEENKHIYQNFYNIKKGYASFNKKCEIIPMILFGISNIVTFLLTGMFFNVILGSVNNFRIVEFISYIIFGFVFASGFAVSLKCSCELSKKMSLKAFKQQYPDFDTSIDINKLKEKLKEYKLEQIPIYGMSKSDDISNEQMHLSFYNNDFKKMTIEEKISFLESEKEFWSQYKENNTEDEKGKQKKKEF